MTDVKRINPLLEFASGQVPTLIEEATGMGEEMKREQRLPWTLRPTLSSLGFPTVLSELPGVEKAGNLDNKIYFGWQCCCTNSWVFCGSLVCSLISGISHSVRKPSGSLLLVVVWLFLDQTYFKYYVHQPCLHSYCSYSHFLWINSR